MTRLLPHDDQAEKRVVGSLMIDGATFGPVAEILGDGAALWDPRLRTVYTAIRALAERGRNVDQLTVEDQLRADGTLEKVSTDLLSDCLAAVDTTVYVTRHAERIRSLADRRRLARLGEQVYQNALDDTKSLDSIRAQLIEEGRRNSGGWPEFQPLPDPSPPIPDIDPALLPDAIRPWLEGMALEKGVPLAALAPGALVSLGTVIGGGAIVHPRVNSNWKVIPHLWAAIMAPVGSQKTGAVEDTTAPLRALAERAETEQEEEIRDSRAEKAVLEAQLSAAKSKSSKHPDKAEIRDIQDRLEACRVRERRYFTSDATPESLQTIQADNPRGILLLRDEISGWLEMMEKSGREGERKYFLEGADGRMGASVDRVGRGRTKVLKNVLSVFGGIQPSVLTKVVNEVVSAKRNDGLLQRLQLLITMDRSKTLPPDPDAPMDPAIFRRVDTIFRTLDHAMDPGKPKDLHLTPEAQRIFDEWRQANLDRLNASPEYIASHLAKYPSTVASIAAINHLVHLVDERGNGGADICAECIRQAVGWAEYLPLHLAKVYATAQDDGMAGARALAGKIQLGAVVHGMTIRDIYHSTHWAHLAGADQVLEAATVLRSLGWLRVVTESTGGRPTRVIHLHPGLREGAFEPCEPLNLGAGTYRQESPRARAYVGQNEEKFSLSYCIHSEEAPSEGDETTPSAPRHEPSLQGSEVQKVQKGSAAPASTPEPSDAALPGVTYLPDGVLL